MEHAVSVKVMPGPAAAARPSSPLLTSRMATTGSAAAALTEQDKQRQEADNIINAVLGSSKA